MVKYIIEGGKKLKGKIEISGNKNAILPCLTAAILTDEDIILRNVPQISDVVVCLNILQELGASVESSEHWVKVNCQNVNKTSLPEELVTKLRASILFAGPLLARFGKVKLFHPGGDVIGKRSVETHLQGFTSLGFHFNISDREYSGSGSMIKKQSRQIFLEETSVTATENLVMASVLGDSEVILKNCAEEPHVVDLCRLLIAMGANIEGVGTSCLKIVGVKKLSGADFTIGSDHIEFGTYAVAAALTDGQIEMDCSYFVDLEPVTFPLKKMGVDFKKNGNFLTASRGHLIASPHLRVNLWPGFPTDLMSAAIVLATQTRGVSLMHDWMYESRMFFVDKLITMGANITVADPHRVLVYGPTELYGRNLETPDIRAGMALVLAALIAKGRSEINRAELIERGYEDVVEKLTILGADIQKIES